MKSLEELLVPVKVPEGWTLADQFKKITEEVQETGLELKKYYEILLKTQEQGETQSLLLAKSLAKLNIGIETGDIIETCITMLSLLGADINDVMTIVYRKNEARKYYGMDKQE